MANLHLFMWTALDAKDGNSLIVLNKVCLCFKVLTNLYNSGPNGSRFVYVLRC